MKRFFIALIAFILIALAFLLPNRSGLDDGVPPPLPSADFAIFENAKIYTADPVEPWAEAMIIHGDRLVFVGGQDEASRQVSGSIARYDLGGRFVMPGIIDSHTHPGLVAILGEEEESDVSESMPGRPLDAILDWLEAYDDANPLTPFVMQGSWDVAEFLPDGPHRRHLDELFPIKPVMLLDNSGHSFWVNSAMLTLLGVDDDVAPLSEVSYFVRDAKGELTGWAKEFALFPYFGDLLVPSKKVLRERFLDHIRFLVDNGVTSLWDAGNFHMDEAVYEIASELDRDGRLPIRYEGSYHIWEPGQIDFARERLLELRRKYAGDKLQFNTIKIHFDGVHEILTAATLTSYETDPGNTGGVLFAAGRLAEFMLELEAEQIDLHFHVVGARATRTALDAVELAQQELGQALSIEITLSHLEYVDPIDIPRFKRLGVHANFTPHWFGGGYFGQAGAINLGPERASQSQVVGRFMDAGANVTLSSDVISALGASRSNPFIGIEMSVTRREFGSDAGSPLLSPADAAISRKSAISAYTLNGARQLGWEEETGSLVAGKLADFIMLDASPLEVDENKIHSIKVLATVVGGQLVAGSLPDAVSK